MKTKQIILTIALFTSLLINAQDKYEFMIISFVPNNDLITIAIDGKEYIKEEVKLEKSDKHYGNANPLLSKVNEYQTKDWEVMSFNTGTVGQMGIVEYFAFLRKKKTDKK